MTSTRLMQSTTVAIGGSDGVAFDGITDIKDVQKAIISRIVLTFDNYIRSIAVHYADGSGSTRGKVVDTKSEIIMTDGEFIQWIDGSLNSVSIAHLTFETNKGNRWGPYGKPNPDRGFRWGDWGPNMGLLYFSGKEESYFRSLQATFATYSSCVLPPNGLRYEQQVDTAHEDSQLDALSTFTQNLMSPTITLVAGPKAMEIHASQGILCQLPFFRAALEGEFREAAEKQIRMPDDDLRSVAALVEYLYTGYYTYPFHNTKETKVGIPAADVAEGSFHVFVYATANKYGCQQLVDTALTSFLHVLSQLKGIDVIRLWVIAYDQGLVLDTVASSDSDSTVVQGLGQLLNNLYKTDREEMDSTTVEHPTLIGDFLRHLVAKDD